MTINLTFSEPKNAAPTNFESSAVYAELLYSYSAKLLTNGRSKQEIKNARTAIRAWCESLSLGLNSRIGAEFTTDFEQGVQCFISERTAIGKKYSTCSSQISLIRSSRNFYLKQSKILSLPDSFGRRLEHLLNVNNYSSKSFWEHHLSENIKYKTLLNWISETSLPVKNNLLLVSLIEDRLAVSPKTLTSLLEVPRVGRGSIPMTFLGKKTHRAKKSRYYVWTDSLRAEFDGLIEYKTAVDLPSEMKRRKNAKWTGSAGDELPPTAIVIRNYLKSFFGFCCLPADNPDSMLRGLSMDKKDLSLSLLTDVEKVKEYFNVFQFKRSGEKYTGGTLRFIHFIISMLRRETGYLYQKPELFYENPTAEDILTWQEKCLETRQKLLILKDAVESEKKCGGEKFGFGRDPQEPIKEILESPRPIHVTMRMFNSMMTDVNKLENQSARQAVLFRDALLVAMLQANPLRIKMFGMMNIGEHLVRNADGSWWLKFKRHDFKNRHSLKSDYQVRVTSSIWSLIDRYVKDFRPRLCGAEKSSRVFLSAGQSRNKTLLGMTTIALSNTVNRRTKQYIPGCPGFGPHAFRHIIATDTVKSQAGLGFFLAARVLHDKLETVEENYAHLKTSEFFEPYNNLFSETWDSLNSSDSDSNGESSDE